MTESDNALVAHLFRRAGFGLRSVDFNRFPLDDYAAAVEALVAPPITKRDDQSSAVIDAGGDDLPVLDAALRDAQTTWVRSMVTTRAPLVERMVLFFANHFATAYSPNLHVDATSLVHQQATIRRHVFGNFAELTHAMVDDLALAVFLNNDRNRRKNPNENMSRELMELFVLGLGNYTERDVKEVARALTGYGLMRIPGARPRLVFQSSKHDASAKTVLGATDAFTPHGVVDHLLAQPAAKRFLATKLEAHFVSAAPDPTLVGAVAKSLQGWDIRAALRAVLFSDQFKSAAVRQTLPKSPAEFVVGIMRGLQRIEYTDAANFMAAAGQTLYRPPSVAGWPTGNRMFGPGAMLARYNAAARLAGYHVRTPMPGTPRSADVGEWMQEFGITALTPSTADAIEQYRKEAGRQTTAARAAGVITLLLASPDYQLS
ncbi:MAG: DUF1800 domain-containing protein [Acidimicrobiales bacterium]|nr:DUF1800 domain-containing protein [Acidimicrobiales bacterium]